MSKKIIIVIVAVILIIAIIVGVYISLMSDQKKEVPTTPPPAIGPWKNLNAGNNSYVPIRIGLTGYLECMSNNHSDCYWRGTSAEVDALIANPPTEATQPLVCTDEWIKNKEHWCYKGTKQLQPSSSKLPASHIRYYMRSNYLQY